MAIILDGKEVAKFYNKSAKDCIEKNNLKGALAVIVVGDNPASAAYVRNKKRACAKVGIEVLEYKLDESVNNQEVHTLIECLNNSPAVAGIFIQLPLPAHLDADYLCQSIVHDKDVDGFTYHNVGALWTNSEGHVPCTAQGIIEMLLRYHIPISGKHCVIIGRSDIVGKPTAGLLLRENATVTICHSRTENLADITRMADIIICAVGKPNFLTANMVREGAVVIDAGINRREDGTMCGDVDFEAVAQKASAITPVPGGVGQMTVAMLIQNMVCAMLIRKQ